MFFRLGFGLGVLVCLFGCFIETVLHSPVWPHTVLELLIHLLLPYQLYLPPVLGLQKCAIHRPPSPVPEAEVTRDPEGFGERTSRRFLGEMGQLCTLEHRRVLLIRRIDFEFRKFQILDCWLLSTTGRHVAALPCLVPEQLQPDMSGHCSVTRLPSSSQPACPCPLIPRHLH